jgi:hypothetical protein
VVRIVALSCLVLAIPAIACAQSQERSISIQRTAHHLLPPGLRHEIRAADGESLYACADHADVPRADDRCARSTFTAASGLVTYTIAFAGPDGSERTSTHPFLLDDTSAISIAVRFEERVERRRAYVAAVRIDRLHDAAHPRIAFDPSWLLHNDTDATVIPDGNAPSFARILELRRRGRWSAVALGRDHACAQCEPHVESLRPGDLLDLQRTSCPVSELRIEHPVDLGGVTAARFRTRVAILEHVGRRGSMDRPALATITDVYDATIEVPF